MVLNCKLVDWVQYWRTLPPGNIYHGTHADNSPGPGQHSITWILLSLFPYLMIVSVSVMAWDTDTGTLLWFLNQMFIFHYDVVKYSIYRRVEKLNKSINIMTKYGMKYYCLVLFHIIQITISKYYVLMCPDLYNNMFSTCLKYKIYKYYFSTCKCNLYLLK